VDSAPSVDGLIPAPNAGSIHQPECTHIRLFEAFNVRFASLRFPVKVSYYTRAASRPFCFGAHGRIPFTVSRRRDAASKGRTTEKNCRDELTTAVRCGAVPTNRTEFDSARAATVSISSSDQSGRDVIMWRRIIDE